jgi:hypothetical protein
MPVLYSHPSPTRTSLGSRECTGIARRLIPFYRPYSTTSIFACGLAEWPRILEFLGRVPAARPLERGHHSPEGPRVGWSCSRNWGGSAGRVVMQPELGARMRGGPTRQSGRGLPLKPCRSRTQRTSAPAVRVDRPAGTRVAALEDAEVDIIHVTVAVEVSGLAAAA